MVIATSIVTYHSPLDEVREAAESLLANHPDVRLTVIDNASGAAYVAGLRAILPDGVTLLEAPRNGGFGYGHNYAMLRAGEYAHYLVLNPDVRLHSGAVAAMLAFLSAHPNAGLIAPRVLYPDGRLQPLNKRDPNVADLLLRRVLPSGIITRISFLRRRMERYQMLDTGYDAACQVPFVSGCCMLLRGDVMRRLGGFDERFFLYFEDADLSRRVREIAEAWYCPDAVITHHWHRASKSSWRIFGILMKSMVTYFTKWGWQWR